MWYHRTMCFSVSYVRGFTFKYTHICCIGEFRFSGSILVMRVLTTHVVWRQIVSTKWTRYFPFNSWAFLSSLYSSDTINGLCSSCTFPLSLHSCSYASYPYLNNLNVVLSWKLKSFLISSILGLFAPIFQCLLLYFEFCVFFHQYSIHTLVII